MAAGAGLYTPQSESLWPWFENLIPPLMALTRGSVGNVITTITIAKIPRVSRRVRRAGLSLREQPYVDATVAAGTRTRISTCAISCSGSRPRGKMPAIEVEADGRQTPLAPPSLTQSGGWPPSIDALRKAHLPWMLAVSDKARLAERTLWNIRRGKDDLLRLDVGRLDHLAPLLGFRGDKPSEV
jgi:hypothetical protein